ncbi:CpaD family pilus assembly protein [Brevundimonas sp.]|uniref:CpaD family pilus assembly protein n=1 Tax=Brevundimonas sp. TaxID=1871086 RepID=UPI0025BC74E6|nr:CpaD family pilus assembly protein [Brevundimonas sp.]
MKHTAIALVFAATALGACATSVPTQPAALNSLSNYVLEVEPGLDRIALAVHDNGLSANQQAALSSLVQRFAAEQADVIRIEGPSGGDPVSAQIAWSVRDVLTGMGVPSERVVVMAYNAPNPRAPVLAGFETLRAHIPNCATAPTQLGGSWSNRTSPDFGCAVTANLAAQIANPRDIVQPRGMTGADQGRRSKVFEMYRAGTATSAPQEELVNGRISKAVD